MKKRLLAFLVCAFMLTGLFAACGGGNSSSQPVSTPEASTPAESTPAETSTPDATEPDDNSGDTDMPAAQGVDGLTIGIAIYDYTDNFMTLYRNELTRYLEAGGATVQATDGKNDQAEQTNQINNFITQGVDVLIINLVQSTAARQITDLCEAADIPVVYINREPDEAEEARWEDEGIKATYVGADARQSGTFQGEIVLDLPNNGDINGDGKVGYVMIMGDPENIDAQYRTEYSIKALTDAEVEVDRLFEQRGDWDQTKGQELAANALVSNGDDIDVIFCNNDAMALGANQAIQAAGRTVGEDIYLLGVDALSDALELIIAGNMTGTVFNDHFSQARTAGDMAAAFAAGDTLKTVYIVDYVKVDQSNAQEILDMVS